MDRPRRKHLDVLREYCKLDGRRVADIGCGDGGLVRALARNGARVIGIEPGLQSLAEAVAVPPSGLGEVYVAGFGEALPLADGSVDLIVFFNSLHHVPIAAQPKALAEAGRVLNKTGCLYIMEPLAEGRYFEVISPVDDETAVRHAADQAIGAAVAEGRFAEEAKLFYDAPVQYASYESLRQRVITIDPSREAAVVALDDVLRARFMEAAEPLEDGYRFWQPSRMNLLRPCPG